MTYIEELKEELERLLMATPDTTEQWAHICLIEKQIIEASWPHDDSALGVGA